MRLNNRFICILFQNLELFFHFFESLLQINIIYLKLKLVIFNLIYTLKISSKRIYLLWHLDWRLLLQNLDRIIWFFKRKLHHFFIRCQWDPIMLLGFFFFWLYLLLTNWIYFLKKILKWIFLILLAFIYTNKWKLLKARLGNFIGFFYLLFFKFYHSVDIF